MKLYAVIGTITPGCGVYIHLYGLHTDRKAAERRRAEVEAAARRANEGEIEDVAPRLSRSSRRTGRGRRHLPGRVCRMTYLAPCPFCGGPVRLVYDGTADGTCYGISHRPGACSILPTVWGAPGVGADTIVRCWNQRYGVANMLRAKGEDGLADEMAYLGRFD